MSINNTERIYFWLDILLYKFRNNRSDRKKFFENIEKGHRFDALFHFNNYKKSVEKVSLRVTFFVCVKELAACDTVDVAEVRNVNETAFGNKLLFIPGTDEFCILIKFKEFLNTAGRLEPTVADFRSSFVFFREFGSGNNILFAAGVGYNPVAGIGRIGCFLRAVSQNRFDNFAADCFNCLNSCKFCIVLNNCAVSD